MGQLGYDTAVVLSFSSDTSCELKFENKKNNRKESKDYDDSRNYRNVEVLISRPLD